MMKWITFVAFGLCVLALPFKAGAVTLRQESVVSDDVIRLGDLFYDLDYNEDRVLGAAPRPGKTMTLSARTLQRVAVALNLDWRPSNAGEYLVIKREATVIDEKTLKDALRSALTDQPVGDEYDISFIHGTPEIILPPNFPASAQVSSVSYDPENHWFEAEFMAPSLDNPQMRTKLSGRIEPLTYIPVLRESIRNGSIINATDIETIKMPLNRINHDVFMDAKNMIGKTARRMVMAGTPVKESELEEPRIVERGEAVTLIYQNGSMRLTASGRAMEFGAKGDVIRVTNLQSSKTINAVVTGQQEVTVQSF